LPEADARADDQQNQKKPRPDRSFIAPGTVSAVDAKFLKVTFH
jgi:hypothetical protein